MSKIARSIMTKYGWKDGEGLGKEKEGVTSYIKVSRRDPKACTGLGHVAEANGSVMESASSELDTVFRSLAEGSYENRSKSPKLKKTDENVADTILNGKEALKSTRSEKCSISKTVSQTSAVTSDEIHHEDHFGDYHTTRFSSTRGKAEKPKREREESVDSTASSKSLSRRSRSSSSAREGDESDVAHFSSCSSTSSEEHIEDKPLTDEELFRRCGGVRLGRGGRHRLFDGKLARTYGSRSSHFKSSSE